MICNYYLWIGRSHFHLIASDNGVTYVNGKMSVFYVNEINVMVKLSSHLVNLLKKYSVGIFESIFLLRMKAAVNILIAF